MCAAVDSASWHETFKTGALARALFRSPAQCSQKKVKAPASPLIYLHDPRGRIIVISGPATRGTYAMWFLDFPTLVLVIAAGLQAGLQAAFGLNAAAALFGAHANVVLCLM